MLGSDRVLLSLALLTAAAVGCAGSEQTQTSSGGQGGVTSSWTPGGAGGTGGATGSGTTTAAGGALTCDNGESTVLAVSELSFGQGSSGEWKKVGFNVDGLLTTSLSTDVCQPANGASASTPYPDGDGGIDNSFGKNLLPILLSVYPNWVEDINNGILSGVFTSLLKIECLPPEGDVPVLNSKLFGATKLSYTPKFDGTDTWPVAPELLSDPQDPDSSTVVFSHSSVLGSTYDAGKDATFIITVPLNTQTGSTSIKLTLYSAHITMTLSPDRKSATGGVIGGVLNTEDLVAEIKKVGALMNLCGTDSFDNILTMVRQASDIMADGTQDPSKTCDGITLGLGFSMKAANLGEVGPETPVGDTCP